MQSTNDPDSLYVNWWRIRIRHHVSELVRLAWPVVLTRTGIIAMVLADTIMVARYSTEEVAYLGLGAAPVVVLIVTSVGLMMGTLVVTANAFGAGHQRECGAVWQRSLPYALGLGIASALVCTLGEPFLTMTGQTPELAAGGGKVLFWLGLGLPANMLFVTNNFFLEAIKRPVPGTIAMICMNIVNIGLNWLLIYGHFGFDEMGATGAAIATSAARYGLAIMLFVYIWTMRGHAEFGIRSRQRTNWRDWQHQRQLGYATGVSGALESTAFAFMTLFAGWLGTYALSAYSLAMNLLSLIFMVALGIATATAVRVSIAHGRADHRDLVLAGWTGLGVNTVLMSLLGLVLLAIPTVLASLYTTDVRLIAMVAPIIAFTAYIMVADGGQVVILSALRGRGDAWLPALAHAVSYIGIMVPVSWWLAFKLGHGVMGLMEGVLIASVFSIILLSIRFQFLAAADRALTTHRANRFRCGAGAESGPETKHKPRHPSPAFRPARTRRSRRH